MADKHTSMFSVNNVQKELIIANKKIEELTQQNCTLQRNYEIVNRQYWELRRDTEEKTGFCGGVVMTAERMENHVREKVRDAYPDLWYSPDPGPGYLEGLGDFNRQIAFSDQ